MGDDIVQLPRDPGSFGRRHSPGPVTLFFGEALGVDLKGGSQRDSAADDTPGGKWDHKEKRPHGDDVYGKRVTRLWRVRGQHDAQHRQCEQRHVDPRPAAFRALTAGHVVIEHEGDGADQLRRT
jgi:hypothetical protein